MPPVGAVQMSRGAKQWQYWRGIEATQPASSKRTQNPKSRRQATCAGAGGEILRAHCGLCNCPESRKWIAERHTQRVCVCMDSYSCIHLPHLTSDNHLSTSDAFQARRARPGKTFAQGVKLEEFPPRSQKNHKRENSKLTSPSSSPNLPNTQDPIHMLNICPICQTPPKW